MGLCCKILRVVKQYDAVGVERGGRCNARGSSESGQHLPRGYSQITLLHNPCRVWLMLFIVEKSTYTV